MYVPFPVTVDVVAFAVPVIVTAVTCGPTVYVYSTVPDANDGTNDPLGLEVTLNDFNKASFDNLFTFILYVLSAPD